MNFAIYMDRISKHTCCKLQHTLIRLYTTGSRVKHNKHSIKNITKNTDLALEHFDGLYSKVYGKSWPSMRLGLLSPKKYGAILNSYDDTDHVRTHMLNEQGAIDVQRYYKKHLQSYTRWKVRHQLLDNKKARKRELMAREQNVSIDSLNIDSIEVSDISDNELVSLDTTDAESGFSSAEDLMDMFSDRRMDDEERYFVNKASVGLSLEDFVPATEKFYKEDNSRELEYYASHTDAFTGPEPDYEIREEHSLSLDDKLELLCFPKGDWSRFPQPQTLPKSGLLSHYMLDASSILPVMALGIQLNDVCADYCAAPGGKSLAMLMTLKPKYLLCNDSSSSRLERLKRIQRQYLPDINYIKRTVKISNRDSRTIIAPDTFDKILVDVPCSNDRQSVENIENNIFKRNRAEERLQLPSVQCDILCSALNSLAPNGSLVYSTCTLSPVENDSVVRRALIKLQEQNCNFKFAVVNMNEAFRPLRGLFRFITTFQYGQQIVPNICSNYGPMYISKIKRLQ